MKEEACKVVRTQATGNMVCWNVGVAWQAVPMTSMATTTVFPKYFFDTLWREIHAVSSQITPLNFEHTLPDLLTFTAHVHIVTQLEASQFSDEVIW